MSIDTELDLGHRNQKSAGLRSRIDILVLELGSDLCALIASVV